MLLRDRASSTIPTFITAKQRALPAGYLRRKAILQAIGAMYIEEVVDFVNNQINQIEKGQNKSTRPRFSPGFGDVSLEVQKDFFSLLPCSKIGLTLMDTLIMAPEKSVTAFVGIY
jgi:hypothetical protein